jgi:hypothetical protein
MDVSSYVTEKLTAAVSGLAGGSSMMAYVRPLTITEAFTRGGTSTACAVIFGPPVLLLLGLPTGWEMQIPAGFIIGFVSYSLLGVVANTLRKYHASDLFHMVRVARGDIEPETKPEPEKPRAKRRKKA